MKRTRRLKVTFPIDSETAVRCAFDKFHEKLGYPKILEARERFPDYILENDKGRKVRAEAKVWASGAMIYKNLTKKCDLVICWRDDWGNCPVPCLELSAYIGAPPEKEVIVVPIGKARGYFNPETEWRVIREKHFYRLPFGFACREQANNIAFYFKGIDFIAKLKLPYEKTTWGKIFDEIYHLTRDEKYKISPKDKWREESAFKLNFGNLKKIKKIQRWGRFSLPRYTTCERLLVAKTVKDL